MHDLETRTLRPDPLCGDCGYSLQGLSCEGRCPECGRSIDARLGKTPVCHHVERWPATSTCMFLGALVGVMAIGLFVLIMWTEMLPRI